MSSKISYEKEFEKELSCRYWKRGKWYDRKGNELSIKMQNYMLRLFGITMELNLGLFRILPKSTQRE